MNGENLFPFGLPIKILKLSGVWQRKSSSWTYFFYGIITHLIFIDLFTFLQFCYFFVFETFEDFAFVMTLFPTFLAFNVKTVILMREVDEICDLLEDVQQFVEQKNLSEKLQKHLKLIDLVFKTYWGSATVACILALGMPLVLHELPYRMWFPYDYTNNELLFWFSVAYQGFVTICLSIVDIILDTFLVVLKLNH